MKMDKNAHDNDISTIASQIKSYLDNYISYKSAISFPNLSDTYETWNYGIDVRSSMYNRNSVNLISGTPLGVAPSNPNQPMMVGR